jgi:hypothetical protein
MIENCPECGAPGAMLIYGLPGPQLSRAAHAGRVGLGGCMIEPGLPDWYCPAASRVPSAEPHRARTVNGEDSRDLSGRHVPDPYGVVHGGGGQSPAVRGEREARYLIGVAGQDAQRPAGRPVAQLDGVFAGRRQQRPVRRERQLID